MVVCHVASWHSEHRPAVQLVIVPVSVLPNYQLWIAVHHHSLKIDPFYGETFKSFVHRFLNEDGSNGYVVFFSDTLLGCLNFETAN